MKASKKQAVSAKKKKPVVSAGKKKQTASPKTNAKKRPIAAASKKRQAVVARPKTAAKKKQGAVRRKVASKPVQPEVQFDFLKAPAPIPDSRISKTIRTDVVVIGAALSGLSAARAALEAGAKVVVIEKATDIVYRSSDIGVINSSIDKQIGNMIDPAEIVTAIQDYYHGRTNGDLWRYWAENSGAALDWWLSLIPNYKLIDEDFLIPNETDEVYVRVPHWPYPAPFDRSKEHYKIYITAHQLMPDMGNALRIVYNKCVEMGGKFAFSTWARQLIRPNNKGRVTGVIAQDKAGNYIKYIARKGVVLCTGDYAGDKKMVEKFCPDVADLYTDWIFPNKDANGVTTHTGDGHKMGMWIGAQMERGPHAPVNHNLGGPVGTDAFLLVNVRGERFMNEDNDGQIFTNAIERQPKNQAFQIFDAKWKEQLECQGICHGMRTSVSPEVSHILGGGWGSNITEEDVLGAAKTSDTLEGLAKELGLPVDAFVATVKRYNELAHAGNDTDFYKRADRLFPVETAPFYGGPTSSALLVVTSGLVVNAGCNVCDGNFEPIPGLYAAGNAMGGRFSADYGLVAAGVSHGSALTFGRLAGQEAAKG
jgi:fumarate reductase flavoprotein subunit